MAHIDGTEAHRAAALANTHALSPSVEYWLYAWLAASVLALFAIAARGVYVWAHLPARPESDAA